MSAGPPPTFRIVVCRGPECGDRRGSRAIYDVLRAAIATHGLADRCELAWQSCFGRCTQGPNVLVREIIPEGSTTPATMTALYNGVLVETAEAIVRRLTGAPPT